MENTVNTDLIRDHVDSFILRFLAKGDSYGYDIHKAISTATDGVYEIKQPTLYSCLKRLEKQGFITSYDGETSNGAQRKYYSITDKGRDFLNVDIEQWEFSRTLLDRLLSDKQIDLATVPRPFDPSELRPRTKRGSGVAAAASVAEDTSSEEPVSPEADTDPAPDEVDSSHFSEGSDLTSESAPVGSSEPYRPELYATQMDIDSYVADQAAEPQPEPILQDFLRNHIADNEDYHASLNEIFSIPVPPSSVAVRQEEPSFEDSRNAFNYGELKERAQAEGYRLHPYSKAVSTSYYSMNFIFSSRLKRDSLLLLYLFMLAEVLIAFFSLDRVANLGYLFYIVTACVLLVCPIVGIILYLIKPDKRIRAEFDLKSALSGMLMLTINLFILSMLFAFFLFHADLNRPSTMIKPILYPFLLFVDLPVYTLIYAALYHTRRYHLK